jgi:hypothetical protein
LNPEKIQLEDASQHCAVYHGTAIMHATATGVTRGERVEQVRRYDPSV